VAGIAAGPASIEERAAALLEPLHRLVPFQAARIALLDQGRRQLVPLVSPGYDDRIRAYGTSPAAVAETELVGLHRARPPTFQTSTVRPRRTSVVYFCRRSRRTTADPPGSLFGAR
jgi:hypothetical protein